MADIVDIKLPLSYDELSQRQLRDVFGLLAAGATVVELRTLCLLRWNGIEVIGHNMQRRDNTYLMRRGKEMFTISAESLAMGARSLGWLSEIPSRPVRIERIGRRRALPADFQGVSFEVYIVCDNLYQGYITTRDESLLQTLAEQLYPGKGRLRLSQAEKTGIFWWMASLKRFFSARFGEFLRPVADGADGALGAPDIRTLMQSATDSQIRALTKGDPTKEADVLRLDCWRALTELNAQAREYRELQRLHKK